MKTSTVSGSAGRIAALFLLCAALCASSSCEGNLEPGPRPGIRAGRDRSVPSDDGSPVFYTTVEFPVGYDWHRDPAYSSANADICLYRNGKKIMEVPAGEAASPAADMHYFIDGHLYTCTCNGNGSVLACDGGIVLKIPKREILKGLLPMEDGLYSLWADGDGNGFCLRKGSEEVLREADGQVYGNLYDHSYLPYGALYPDRGMPAFCYSAKGQWYAIYGGDSIEIFPPSGIVLDVRMIGGKACFLNVDSRGKSLLYKLGDYTGGFREQSFVYQDSGRIYLSGDDPVFAVNTSLADGSRNYTSLHFTDGRRRLMIPEFDSLPLSLDDNVIMLSYSPDGFISLSGTEVADVRSDWNCFHMGGSPGIFDGEVLAVAFNPAGTEGKPVLWKNGKKVQLEINGFISGVYASSQ